MSSLGVLSLGTVFFCVFMLVFCLDGAVLITVVLVGRSGVVQGLGCARRVLGPSGVMAAVRIAGSAVFCVVGLLEFCVPVGAKDKVVCRTALESISFDGVSLFCLAFAPFLGEEPLPFLLLELRRLLFFAMVDLHKVVVPGVRSSSAYQRRDCVGFL